MPLFFNTLLAQAGIAFDEVRLLRHRDRRSSKGRSPYELWRDERPSFEWYQQTQSPNNHSKLKGKFWASFVGAASGETLFAGLYACAYVGKNPTDRRWVHAEGADAAGTCDIYQLNPDVRFSDLIGRIVIEWGDGARSWIQRADKQNKIVCEIRRRFKEEEFPGFSALIKSLSDIDRFPIGWIEALRSSRGVYLLTCPKTKEQYVGSASGANGFYGRWRDYVRDGHGGNEGLKSNPSDYQVSILEVAGSLATPEDVRAMEMRWKNKLQSREMGLNRN